uniref:MD-2-related lipid-recognition domain-containing protein n=1 Tax=Hemiselmis andersenii TaxID=464988 RepID=A0A6U4ZI64_HEMAN|mmetsp:Transcript_34123/g.79989  ORF Transcript_34123/g.79989 Transcript_34123/m.79989 type:complete len:234 (+) Transcript_34123:89-790(+)
MVHLTSAALAVVMAGILGCVVAIPIGTQQRNAHEAAFAAPTRNSSSPVAASSALLDKQGAPNPPLPFSWKTCNQPGDPTSITEMSVSPSPVTLSKTGDREVTVSMTAGITVDITNGTSFSLLIKKRVPFTTTFEKIPCLDGYGSCTYPDLCGSLNDAMPTCNDWFQKHKISCHCPFAAQTISAPPSAFSIPAVGDKLPSWLADGDFQVTVTALDGQGAELGCVFMQMSLRLEA